MLAGRRRTDFAAARAYAERFTPSHVAAGYARRYRELLAAARPEEPRPAEPALTVAPPAD